MGVLQGIGDVILILAALLSLIAFAFLAYAGWIIIRLVKEVKGEVKTVSGSAKETLQEVQETGRFVSGSVVRPASVAFGYVTAVTATIKALSEKASNREKS